MKHCVHCDREVRPIKKFSWGWFLIWCITFVGGIVYIIYYAFFKKKECPICRSKDLRSKPKNKPSKPQKPLY